ncbi:MAG TPA: DNA primase [Acidobacteriaceae bacterium]
MADSFSQQVKDQADIVRIIGDYVKLRKAGAQNYTGLCPFHKEKSGSFSVNVAKRFYYCFGCHETGDVFTFVMKMDNVSFPEAVRAVAQKVGIALPQKQFHSADEAREAGERRQLMEIHEAATQYFEQNLKSPEAARAREYLTGRGLSAETIAKFRIGYAPESFNDMRDRLGKHFGEEVLRGSGLFSAKEQEDGSQGQMYAKFRKRITFPIANEQGKTIAFTARLLEEQDAKSGPKYLNSPETLLYTKGRVLFNLDKAKAAMREQFALLVEGQMDCISVYAAGLPNVIATSGTAFTEAQVRLLNRFTNNVVLNFDPDQAGAKATDKTIEQLVEAGFKVRVHTLGEGLDPDRYIRERGAKRYFDAVRASMPYRDFYINYACTLFPVRTPEGKVKALNYLLPRIRHEPELILREEFANNAAQRLGIENSLLHQELRRSAAQRLESVRAPQAAALSELERVLLRALVLPDADAARELAAMELGAHPEWYGGLPSAGLMETLANASAPDNPMDAANDDGSRSLLAIALHEPSDESRDAMVVQVRHALTTLHRRNLERRQRELRAAIAAADRAGDQEMLRKLMEEKLAVDRALREL